MFTKSEQKHISLKIKINLIFAELITVETWKVVLKILFVRFDPQTHSRDISQAH